jgi:hypothetical protein
MVSRTPKRSLRCVIHQDEVALAEAPPSLWGDYAAGKVN